MEIRICTHVSTVVSTGIGAIMVPQQAHSQDSSQGGACGLLEGEHSVAEKRGEGERMKLIIILYGTIWETNFYKGANTFLKGGGALHETQLSIVGLYKDI